MDPISRGKRIMIWMQALRVGDHVWGSSCSQTPSRSIPIVAWWCSMIAAYSCCGGTTVLPSPHPHLRCALQYPPGRSQDHLQREVPERMLDSPVSKTPSRDLPTFPRVTSPASDETPTEPSRTTCANSPEEISQQVAKNHASQWIFKEPSAEWSNTSGPLWPFLGEESQQSGLVLVIILADGEHGSAILVLCSLTQGTCPPFLFVNTSRYLCVPPFKRELPPYGE